MIPEQAEHTLQEMIAAARVGETEIVRTIKVGNKSHHVRLIFKDGYIGFVDGGYFGDGKKPATAMNGVRKRIEFLMTNSASQGYDSERARNASAASDLKELNHRKKLGY